jgi:integrase
MTDLNDPPSNLQAPHGVRPSKPRGVKRIRKPNGAVYHYHRKTMTPLPGEPWSPEFMAALEAAEAGVQGADLPDTASAVGFSYLASDAFLRLAPASQAVRRRVIEEIITNYGHCGVGERSGLTREMLEVRFDCLATYVPGWARVYLSGWRAFIQHAIKLGIRKTDCTAGIKRAKLHNPDGIATWSEEDIAAFREWWLLGTMERLAFELLLGTGQRRGDVIRMCRAHIKSDGLHVRQSKTGASLVLPVVPELQAALDAMPPNDSPFAPFLTRDGEPFEPLAFTCWFRRAALAAGLAPGRTAHGLRKAACRRLAEAGCSANIIAAISGHRDWREVQRYTRAAEQARLARQGMDAVADTFGANRTGPKLFSETPTETNGNRRKTNERTAG